LSSSNRGVLREINWNEICPWLILVRALRVSLMVRVLVLALVGVLLTQWGWAGLTRLFSLDEGVLSRITVESQRLTGETFIGLLESGPLLRAWNWLSSPITELLLKNQGWRQCLALVLCGVWTVIVWGLLGGAISRIAALYLTRGEAPGPVVALRSTLPRWGSIVLAPLIPGAVVVLIMALLAAVGLVARFDFPMLIVGLAWGFVLVWGFLLAVIVIGLMVGWPLMWATISVERTDAFDGVSRCYAYVYQRPLQLMFYVLLASLLGNLGAALVQLFASATVLLAEWAVGLGAGYERMGLLTAKPTEELGGMVNSGMIALRFWKSTVLTLAASFSLAYLWSAAVGIYLLLRRHVDSTELDEVALEENELGEGLPPLEPHSSGVPSVESPAAEDAPDPEGSDDP